MTDIEDWEIPAYIFASQCAGEYIEELGKTNLADFTEAEWNNLITVIAQNFSLRRAEIAIDNAQ